VRIVHALHVGSLEMPRKIDIATLMLFIAVIAVCLAVWRLHPLLGVPLTVVTAVALVRTSCGIARAQVVECPLETTEQVYLFVESFGVSIVIVFPALAVGLGIFLLFMYQMGSPSRAAVILPFTLLPAVLVGVQTGRNVWPIRHARFTRLPRKPAASYAAGGTTCRPPNIEPK
jgi:hypothetical protein